MNPPHTPFPEIKTKISCHLVQPIWGGGTRANIWVVGFMARRRGLSSKTWISYSLKVIKNDRNDRNVFSFVLAFKKKDRQLNLIGRKLSDTNSYMYMPEFGPSTHFKDPPKGAFSKNSWLISECCHRDLKPPNLWSKMKIWKFMSNEALEPKIASVISSFSLIKSRFRRQFRGAFRRSKDDILNTSTIDFYCYFSWKWQWSDPFRLIFTLYREYDIEAWYRSL